MALVVGTNLGPYQILSPIGSGGMGEVYRARDPKLKRDVAIKVLSDTFAADPARLARFQREAEVLASLNHPNIAHIYGVEERALVMELVEGESPKGPLPFDDAWKIASQIAAGLEYAHEKGIVHRDLKPANIKVTPDGVVKLLDFGLAKAFSNQPEPSANPEISPTLTIGATEMGVILGTAAYMAPEQAKGKSVDKRADIWAFGVVLWELLTGERPFQGEDVSETLAAVIKEEPDLSRVPWKARRLLKSCLEKDSKKRLRDIGDAVRQLEDGQEILPTRTPARSRILPWALASLFALAALVIGFLGFRNSPPEEPVQRYAITMPDNATLNSLALSPDGRYVAIAANVNGRFQLWLRPLARLQAQPMPTTEGAALPFWSPDSRYIGFFAQGKLKKVAASGGPAQTLCDVTLGGGGTWNTDDVILFSNIGAGNVVRRVPAAGGAATDVWKGNSANISSPIFLPDGRHFLYLLRGSSPDKNGINMGSLDNQDSRRVLPDMSTLSFAPPLTGSRTAHILFLRENNLMAQPFDTATNEPAGDVFRVAEDVFPTQNAYAPVTVSANGVLLYWTGGLPGGSNQLLWYDRSGKMSPAGVTGNVIMPSISPDQKMIAFSRSVGAADIWLRDLLRGTDIRFTSDAMQNFTPVWSPKGDRIAFRSNRPDHVGDLFVKPANGSGLAESLLSTPNQKVITQWSRDGRFLVYYEVNPNTKRDIWVLPMGEGAADRKPIALVHTESEEIQGQLSPDSRWLAYTSDESGQREVYVRPFPAAERVWKISTAGGEQPRWRGDGQELFYVALDGKMTVVPVKASAGSEASFEPGVPVPLFDVHIVNFGAQYMNYDVTANGKRFLVDSTASGGSGTATLPLTVVVNWNAELKK